MEERKLEHAKGEEFLHMLLCSSLMERVSCLVFKGSQSNLEIEENKILNSNIATGRAPK